MVNVVPREVPRPKPEGPQAPWVLGTGPPEALHSPWYLQGFFMLLCCVVLTIVRRAAALETVQKPRIFIATRTIKEGFLSSWVWPMDSLGSPLDIKPGLDSEYW